MIEKHLEEVLKRNLNEYNPKITFCEVWENAETKVNNKCIRRFGIKKLLIPLAAVMLIIIGTGAVTYHMDRVDDIRYIFKDDPNILGEWKVIDIVNEEKDFVPEQVTTEVPLYLRGLRFEPQGTLTYALQPLGEEINYFTYKNAWTKNHIINTNEKTNSAYEIKKIKGKEYLFYQWKSDSYVQRDSYNIPVYVLERGTIEKDTKSVIIDDMTYQFEDDPSVRGIWETIDFVTKPEAFLNTNKVKHQKELHVKQLNFEEKGKFSISSQKEMQPLVTTIYEEAWTKNYVLNREDKTKSMYYIRKINGTNYLFYEWKSGCYLLNGSIDGYYVLIQK